MPVSSVHIDASLVFFNLAYALATEREEVMCLLYGLWNPPDPDGPATWPPYDVCKIVATSLVRRIDKRRDRVEISPETLVAASEEAEKMGLRVVGWLHSHPHVTILPSHVDLRTQAGMQMLDDRFVGLIASVYNPSPSLAERISMIAFQSTSSGSECVEIPLVISSNPVLSRHTIEQFRNLPRMFLADLRGNFGCEAPIEDPFAGRLKFSGLGGLHAASAYTGTVVEIVDRIVAPTCAAFDARRMELKRKIGEMRKQIETGKVETEEEEEWLAWPPVPAEPAKPVLQPPIPQYEEIITQPAPSAPPMPAMGLGIIGLAEPARYQSMGLEPSQREPQISKEGPGWQRLPAAPPPAPDSRGDKPRPPPRVAVPPPSQAQIQPQQQSVAPQSQYSSSQSSYSSAPQSQQIPQYQNIPIKPLPLVPQSETRQPPPPPQRTAVPPPSSGSTPNNAQYNPGPTGSFMPQPNSSYGPPPSRMGSTPPNIPSYQPALIGQQQQQPSAPPYPSGGQAQATGQSGGQSGLAAPERTERKPGLLRRWSPSRS